MGIILTFIGVVGFATSLIILLILAIQKKPKIKPSITLVVCFVLVIVGSILSTSPEPKSADDSVGHSASVNVESSADAE